MVRGSLSRLLCVAVRGDIHDFYLAVVVADIPLLRNVVPYQGVFHNHREVAPDSDDFHNRREVAPGSDDFHNCCEAALNVNLCSHDAKLSPD